MKRRRIALSSRVGRQIRADGMVYAPTSELGVVLLFGSLAPKLGYSVESVHPWFPDCTATYRGERVRIEFEFRARDFKSHGHDPLGADHIVCWENDWQPVPPRYRHLKILSLKPYVNARPRVFMVSCNENLTGKQLNSDEVEWTVPSQVEKGDLIVIYRSAPPGRQVGIRRLVTLQRPLTFEALKKDPFTRNLSVVRARFQGKREITEDWSSLYPLITGLNPTARKKLEGYSVSWGAAAPAQVY
ncbi:MAG: hypothetical protein ACKOEC_11030 [Acidimicrobiia bacterium]